VEALDKGIFEPLVTELKPLLGDPLVPPQIYIGVDRRVRAPESTDINVSIIIAIQEEADFVIFFLGREAMKSEWVRREFEWALEREKQSGRVFVLPVLFALLKLNA
jgi:hypothetical protein